MIVNGTKIDIPEDVEENDFWFESTIISSMPPHALQRCVTIQWSKMVNFTEKSYVKKFKLLI